MADLKWWQKAVFYQIYPRSFFDATGDGIGDLPGIIQKLGYLADLGIQGIWLSPHYPSPLFDVGYDISDYITVGPEYGTMDDFIRFLDEAHKHDIRVILDLVLNHTSNQHPWFLESRSGKNNPKRDWYIWRAGRGENPPNNWNSTFGGPAWEPDSITGEYYYHFFYKEQSDLNWRNPEVKQAMFDVIRFWLDLGVDGYRLDAIGTIFEDPEMRDHRSDLTEAELYHAAWNIKDEEARKNWLKRWEEMFGDQVDQPGLHELMSEIRAIADEYDDCVLVGETDLLAYCGDDQLHMVFNFPLFRTNRLTPDWIRANQEERLGSLPEGCWPCNTLSNHDTSRILSHFGDSMHDGEIARLCLALMLTLRGTPFLYNGEEIGMTDLLLTDLSQFRDTRGLWLFSKELELGTPEGIALQLAARYSRDRSRTPLQWENAPNAGFSPEDVQTWLPVNPNYAEGVNVADQQEDPGTLWHFYRDMLHLRKKTPALIAGDYRLVHTDAKDYLAFLRSDPGSGASCLVVMNFSPQTISLAFENLGESAKRIFSSAKSNAGQDRLSELIIEPFEIYIAEV